MSWLSQNPLSRWTLWLALLLALGLFVAAVLGLALGVTEETSDTIFWVLFLGAGTLLILAGISAFARSSPWLGLILITLGAIAGSVALFWSVIVPIAAILLIVLAVRDARRLAASVAVERGAGVPGDTPTPP